MREAKIFCSVRDTDVDVVLTDEPLYDGQASIGDAELICLGGSATPARGRRARSATTRRRRWTCIS